MKRYNYTCFHCGTGMVMQLPAHCPECNAYLNKEIKVRTKSAREKEAQAAHADKGQGYIYSVPTAYAVYNRLLDRYLSSISSILAYFAFVWRQCDG